MLNLIDRDVFGDNVTKFMTEAMISQNVLLKTQLYYGNWNNQMQLRPRQTEQLDDDIYIQPLILPAPVAGPPASFVPNVDEDNENNESEVDRG